MDLVGLALLYRQAYRKGAELGLAPLEIFDVRAAAGAHLGSAGVGAAAMVIALFAAMPYPVFSGFTHFLMGPAQWVYGVGSRRRRTALDTRLGAPLAAAST